MSNIQTCLVDKYVQNKIDKNLVLLLHKYHILFKRVVLKVSSILAQHDYKYKLWRCLWHASVPNPRLHSVWFV